MKIELVTKNCLFLINTKEELDLIVYDLEKYLITQDIEFEYTIFEIKDFKTREIRGYELKLEIFVDEYEEFEEIQDGLTDIIGVNYDINIEK
jgi:hypothetical protein